MANRHEIRVPDIGDFEQVPVIERRCDGRIFYRR
jgi:hypothetical protein